MKIFTKKFLATIILLTGFFFAVNAQTNVSGGIYANTTWTLAGSPYIVTADLVVFPGYTLTIQPGVVVKFDSGVQLEIRQAGLIALGTSVDSITFTTNTSPVAGSWNRINLSTGTTTSKFSYCNFRYAVTAIADNRGGVGDSLIVNNSYFSTNGSGVYGQGTFYGIFNNCIFRNNTNGMSSNYGGHFNNCDFSYNTTGFDCDAYNTLTNCTLNHNNLGMGNVLNSIIDNCIVNYNQTGIVIINSGGSKVKNTVIDSNAVMGISMSGGYDSIFNCQIMYNGIGLEHLSSSLTHANTITKNDIEYNSVGIHLQTYIDSIHCNKICNNTSYGFRYTGTPNISAANNYWCTSDSASTQVLIYDGHNNINYGLVNFMPLDVSCYMTTGISTVESPDFSFSIFPNPNNGNFTLTLKNNAAGERMEIYNSIGQIVQAKNIVSESTAIDMSGEAKGIYFCRVISTKGIVSCGKFIVE